MFTGIVENTGVIDEIVKDGTNVHFTLSCPFSSELKIDQSVAHDGTCLTVVKCDSDRYTVTAIEETLLRTCLRDWSVGDVVNLERCLRLGDRLDGHMVQGHVDTTGTLLSAQSRDGSHVLKFSHPISDDNPEWMTVSKGSITINGISLTVVESSAGAFSVAMIPYTWTETNMHKLEPGDTVNLEFDIFGKYITKMLGDRA
ncbi:MAG TPA: riboflavin synthase [Flavobacteriales bacterium]|nr:riboflavin synthase [Flavobacteriales bacterium]HIO15710.1 riboflavin synthase [Flavobacteriales bacterium]